MSQERKRHMIAIIGSVIIALSWGSAAVIEQFIAQSNPNFGTVLTSRAIVTLCTAIPLAFTVSFLFKQGIIAKTPTTWWWSIASQLCTVTGAGINLWLLRKYPVSTVIVIAGLYPVVSALISVLIGNEQLSFIQWIGLIFLSIGLGCFFYGQGRSL